MSAEGSFSGVCSDCGADGLDPELRRGGEDFLLCDECRDLGEAGSFVLTIEPGNEEMRRGGDVAEQLRELAERLAHSVVWEGEGPIIDRNGNTVGRWTFHDHN